MGTVLLITPKNHIRKIEAVWMAVSVDDGGEGVCAVTLENGILTPLIAADEVRLEWLRRTAEMVSKLSGKQVKLIKLTQRTDIEAFP